jgi:hypothetical protein
MLSLDKSRQWRRMGAMEEETQKPIQQKAQQASRRWKWLILILTVADFLAFGLT